MPVIVLQIAHADLGEEAVALEHLDHGPLQRAGCLFRVGNHGDIQVRDAVIDTELDHLRVDHDEPHLIRPRFVEQRQDQRVHAHRLAGAGGAGDQHMRQLRNIAHDAVAADVLANGKAQAGLGVLELCGGDDVAEIDGADDLVGHFDADGGDLVRDRRDADVHDAQRQRQVAREIRDAGELDALLKLDIVARDRGAARDADDRGVDAKAADRSLEAFPVQRDLVPRVDSGCGGAAQQIQRREHIVPLLRLRGNGVFHRPGLFLDALFAQLFLRRIGNLCRHGNRRSGSGGLRRDGELAEALLDVHARNLSRFLLAQRFDPCGRLICRLAAHFCAALGSGGGGIAVHRAGGGASQRQRLFVLTERQVHGIGLAVDTFDLLGGLAHRHAPLVEQLRHGELLRLCIGRGVVGAALQLHVLE